MSNNEQARFDDLYQRHLTALKLQGMRPATIDAYSRAVRRVNERLGCPDQLQPADLKEYFSDLVDSHSWSTVKLDRYELQFFYRHVLERDWEREWEWVKIVRPQRVRTLPEILSQVEIAQLLHATQKMRFRAYFLTVYNHGPAAD